MSSNNTKKITTLAWSTGGWVKMDICESNFNTWQTYRYWETYSVANKGISQGHYNFQYHFHFRYRTASADVFPHSPLTFWRATLHPFSWQLLLLLWHWQKDWLLLNQKARHSWQLAKNWQKKMTVIYHAGFKTNRYLRRYQKISLHQRSPQKQGKHRPILHWFVVLVALANWRHITSGRIASSAVWGSLCGVNATRSAQHRSPALSLLT